MVRKKKSLLFTASLASAGLVAGALFAMSPKTQAAEDIYGASANDATIQSISNNTGTPESIVKDSFDTYTLIIGTTDEGELKNNADIVSYEKVADGVYIAVFSDYESTIKNYQYFNADGRNTKAELNIPLEIMDAKSVPTALYTETGIHEFDKCFNIDKNSYTFNNFTLTPDQCLPWGSESMKLLDYAKAVKPSKTVKVAVIDSGIHANHYAFSRAREFSKDRLDMSLAYDYYDSDNNPDDGNNAYDSDGKYRITHGTSVAGLIAESTPSNVKIVPIRIANGAQLDMALVLRAVSSIKGKVDVINLSLGSKTKFAPGSAGYNLYDQVMKEAKAAGSIIVAAAGNSGQNFVSWPASSAYTIAVGATDNTNKIVSFSQYGDQIDFAAPGDMLLLPAGDNDSSMTLASGTSFSAPLISAAVANLLSEKPNMNYDQVYNELKLNAEDIGAAGKDVKSGWGSVSFRINKFADINITASPQKAWSKDSATISAKATSSAYNVNKYAILSGNTTSVAPASWKTISAPAKTVDIAEKVNKNGTYTIWFKNANNEISAKTVTVSSIDNKAPFISTGFAVTEISEESATLSIGVKDTASGLSKIVWHYKAAEDEKYTDEIEMLDGEGASLAAVTTKTFALTDLVAEETYMAYATIYDVAGNSKDSVIATFKATFNGEPVFTEGDKEEPETPTVTPAKQPVGVKTVRVANPNTSDVNLPAIAGIGGTLLAVALFFFRTKRR